MAEPDPISSKISRLNQLLQGKLVGVEHKSLVCRDGLFDALLALFDECTHKSLMKNQYVANFVNKYAGIVEEIKKLRICIKDFEVKSIIGRGHFGEVKVVREKGTGDVYALKILRKDDTLAQQNVSFYEEERDIMAQASSVWLTQLQYAFQDKHNLYLVMEFHPGGDLLSLLGRYEDVFEESMARFYLAEMVMAVHTLHSMGYVHRDVKPENVLIDRTGHIKLADFGSACRSNDEKSTCANMPVGTPDYISPEALSRMNSDAPQGKFGVECDWWSLGVCAYEMLYGSTPFTATSGHIATTYANIMNFKKCLKLPSDVGVSRDAEELITCLLTDAQHRLAYDAICVHPFFTKIDLDNIRHSRPPFIPTVTSNDDVSNFEEFGAIKPRPHLDDVTAQGFTGKHLPFVGFTFTKCFPSGDKPSLTDSVASPACKNSLERRLAAKSSELQEMRERCKNLEDREANMQSQIRTLETKLLGRESDVQRLETERDTLERSMAHYVTETKSLQRLMEYEKEQRANDEKKALKMLEQMKSKIQHSARIQQEEEIEEMNKLIGEIEKEKELLEKRLARMDRECKKEKRMKEEADEKCRQLQERLEHWKESSRLISEDNSGEIEALKEQLATKERGYKARIEQSEKEIKDAMSLVEELRDVRTQLEKEVMELKTGRSSEALVRKKLFASEEKRRSLESELQRLSLMEKREEHLRNQLEDKTQQLRQYASNITDLEERLENREIEYKKCERIYAQREEQHLQTISELEEELAQARTQKCSLEESSIMAFEEVEEKMKIIQEQECTIVQMKGSMNVLEEQVQALRSKVEKHMYSPRKQERKSRRSGAVQTDSPCASPVTKVRRVSGQAQTDDVPSTSGYTQTDDPHDRVSGGCQTDSQSTATADVQTSLRMSPSRPKSPKRVSFQCQAETGQTQQSPSLTLRRSNLTQTSPVKTTLHIDRENSRSGDTLTSISVNVKVKRRSDEQGQGDRDSLVSVKSDDSSDVTLQNSLTSMDSSVTSFDSDRPRVIGKLNTEFWEDKGKQRTRSPEKSKKVKVAQTTWTPKRCAEKATCQIQTDPASQSMEGSAETQDKEKKRKLEEQISDMKQEKIYLEYKIDSLEDELKKVKVNKDEQRIRALDLKHELSERTRHYENKLDEIRGELTKVKLTASEASANKVSYEEKEAALKARLEKSQQELDKLRLDSRVKTTKLQDERDDLESNLKVYKSRCERLEENEVLLKKALDETEADLQSVTDKYIQLAPKSKETEMELKRLQEDKTKFKLEADKLRTELTEKRRSCDMLEQQVKKLKEVCSELEKQVTDYDTLNSAHEQRQATWTEQRGAIEKQVEEKEEEVRTCRRQLEREKHTRQKAEEKRDELSALLQTTRDSYEEELERVKRCAADDKTRLDVLNHQLTQMERERALVEVDNKNLKRRLVAVQHDQIKLKEEMSALITRAAELKSSNLRLSKNLEESMDRYDLLANQNTDLQNNIDALVASHEHERYKLDATMSQQAKLIDYLQAKVENAPKKKKGIFAGRREDHPPSIQIRELQHSLEHEREKNAQLKQQIIGLKDELHQKDVVVPNQTTRGRRFVSDTPSSTASTGYYTPSSTPTATPKHLEQEREAILSTLMLSPNNKPGPGGYQGGSMSVPKTTRSARAKKERSRPGKAHRFATGLNSKATNCAVCLGSVLFVKQAAKCDDCKIVCHPKCVAHVLSTCGAATEYARHYADTLRQARTTPTMRLSVADLALYMSTHMKVPRPGKQLWEKRYVILKDNHVLILEREQTGQGTPLDSFALCPADGEVSVHSAVTAAELTGTSSADLPYILRLEYEPQSSEDPGRSLYLMALNFADKQKWVAVLEAIVNHSGKENRLSNAKVLGNMILTLSKRRLEINCTLPLQHHDVLVGTDEGLYLLELNKTADSRSFIKIEGVPSVAMMALLPALEKIVMVTGKSRDLMVVDVGELEEHRHDNPPTVTPSPVADISTVTTFTWSARKDGIYLCVAQADDLGITVLKYSDSTDKFCVKQDLLISEPCSCMYMGEDSVIFGAEKFHQFDFRTYAIKDFLDKSDMSLAFAVYGASHYESFPIEVLKVSPADQLDEFLLCFQEFGVFVDGRGRRTRDDDMKWSGLPLMFAYREPYLFIVHFNTLQVIQILPRGSQTIEGKKTMLNLPGPRYLGPAMAPGSVYIASLHESATEIICFRGNMADPRDHKEDDVEAMKENIPLYATPKKTPCTGEDKKKAVLGLNREDTSSESGEFISPQPPPVSPPKISDLSGSPVGRRRRNSDVSTTSEESCASVVTSQKQTFDNEPRRQAESAKRYASEPEPCHKTIKTLKQVLAEQSRQRRGYGNPSHNT